MEERVYHRGWNAGGCCCLYGALCFLFVGATLFAAYIGSTPDQYRDTKYPGLDYTDMEAGVQSKVVSGVVHGDDSVYYKIFPTFPEHVGENEERYIDACVSGPQNILGCASNSGSLPVWSDCYACEAPYTNCQPLAGTTFIVPRCSDRAHSAIGLCDPEGEAWILLWNEEEAPTESVRYSLNVRSGIAPKSQDCVDMEALHKFVAYGCLIGTMVFMSCGVVLLCVFFSQNVMKKKRKKVVLNED